MKGNYFVQLSVLVATKLLTVTGMGVQIPAKERYRESQITSRLELKLQAQPLEITGNEVVNQLFSQKQGCTQGKKNKESLKTPHLSW